MGVLSRSGPVARPAAHSAARKFWVGTTRPTDPPREARRVYMRVGTTRPTDPLLTSEDEKNILKFLLVFTAPSPGQNNMLALAYVFTHYSRIHIGSTPMWRRKQTRSLEQAEADEIERRTSWKLAQHGSRQRNRKRRSWHGEWRRQRQRCSRQARRTQPASARRPSGSLAKRQPLYKQLRLKS